MVAATSYDMPIQELENLVSEFRKNVLVKDRTYLLTRYKECFVGKEAVDWLISTTYASTRTDAVSIGNVLSRMGVFHHVPNCHGFRDAHCLYRFSCKNLASQTRVVDGVVQKPGIALIAHNNMKSTLLQWTIDHRTELESHKLVATGTTGAMIAKETGLTVELMKSGPLGGDQQIGALIAEEKIDTLIFFWDPLTAQPHDSDVKALLRLAVQCNVAIAMNVITADLILAARA